MYSSVFSASIFGVEARKVRVEVDVSNGLPGSVMVGYLSGVVKETMERVRTALKNSGFQLEPRKITVNLAPAGFKKEGNFFDLPVALSILAAYGKIPEKNLEGILVVGELGLNGELCPVKGVLPIVMEARKAGIRACMVPRKNQREAEKVGALPIIGVENLKEAAEYVTGVDPKWKKVTCIAPGVEKGSRFKGDFQEIKGQETAKRAAEIAVSGFHNLLFLGPPGSGKSLLASRIPSIFPPLSREESLEVSSIYSIAGLLGEENPLLFQRPFRAPHHTISPQALTGGNRPGELSLAHRGILFLDELPEFNRQALELLRQPLEERKIRVSRSHYSVEFPADLLLLAAMNPCKCGYYPDKNRCTCTPGEIHRYLHKLSHPLLDRMDLATEVKRVPFLELQKGEPGESSETIRKRVEAVHEIQRLRYEGTGYRFNGDLDAKGVARYCQLQRAEERLLEQIYQKLALTARGCHRLLKVARTLADMEGRERILEHHLAEAMSFRAVDQKYWS